MSQVLKTSSVLGAWHEEKTRRGKHYEAETDFFEILQTVNRERRELEMGAALQEISDQRAYIEYNTTRKGQDWVPRREAKAWRSS
jgi:DNA-binding transcriptional regulator GbsR (MarR family)